MNDLKRTQWHSTFSPLPAFGPPNQASEACRPADGIQQLPRLNDLPVSTLRVHSSQYLQPTRIEYLLSSCFVFSLLIGELGQRTSRRGVPDRQQFRKAQKAETDSKPLERFINREWRPGDVYSPHDLSAEEMRKWKRRQGPSTDIFDAVGMNPLDLYKVRYAT